MELMPINIRAEKLLKEICLKEAEKEARTLSSFIINCILTYLREHKGIDYFEIKAQEPKKKLRKKP
jgi:hypothetical protein